LAIRYSYCVAGPDVESETVTAFRGGWKEAVAALAEMGYHGIELVVKDVSNIESTELERVLAANGLALAAICTGEIFGEDGLSFTSPEATVRRAAAERVMACLDLAGRLGGAVTIGRVRGAYAPEMSKDETERLALDAFRRLSAHAAQCGSRLVLEPINRFQCNFINTVAEGLEWVEKVGSPQFQLMLDVFHLNIEERAVPKAIERAGQHVKMVHVCSNQRHAPGEGHLPWAQIRKALEQVNFDGFLSGEIINWVDDRGAAQKTITFLKKVFEP